jgi:hypothetical protein
VKKIEINVIQQRVFELIFIVGLATLVGCSSKPQALVPVSLSPDESAQRAMDAYDKSGDSMLDAGECSPGFLALMKTADENGDGKLDVNEISTRLNKIEAQGIALTTLVVSIQHSGNPVRKRKIRLSPDPVFPNLSSATGVTDEFGMVSFFSEGQTLDGVQPGLFSVEISQPDGFITAKKGLEIGLAAEGIPVVDF